MNSKNLYFTIFTLILLGFISSCTENSNTCSPSYASNISKRDRISWMRFDMVSSFVALSEQVSDIDAFFNICDDVCGRTVSAVQRQV